MFKIYGKYMECGWEEIDSCDTEKELQHLLGEYRMAFGTGWSFRVKKGGRWI